MSADADFIREALERASVSFAVSPEDPHPVADLFAALDRLEAENERLTEQRRRVPTDEGGPGREETYWLRAKLDAAITHLRDVEDYYRLRGGLPEGFNMVRADRARDLYEAITEDFVNGKMSRPTRAETEAALARVEGEAQALREALRRIMQVRLDEDLDLALAENHARFEMREIAHVALAAGVPEARGEAEAGDDRSAVARLNADRERVLFLLPAFRRALEKPVGWDGLPSWDEHYRPGLYEAIQRLEDELRGSSTAARSAAELEGERVIREGEWYVVVYRDAIGNWHRVDQSSTAGLRYAEEAKAKFEAKFPDDSYAIAIERKTLIGPLGDSALDPTTDDLGSSPSSDSGPGGLVGEETPAG